jgi:thymidine kinase
VLLSDICAMADEEIRQYDAVIVDEIQFAAKDQIDFLAHIVDDLNVPVLCYGLRADFQNNLFEGSERLIAICDEIKEIKTVCWCGKKAICNARYNKNGIVREGTQIMLGANDEYIALCRKHFLEGKLYGEKQK